MKRTLSYRISVILLPILLIALFAALPIFAQESTETPDSSTTIVTGAVEFTEAGDIVVGDYIIAPAGAFRPSSLNEGDVVIIIGRLLPDGQTVQADSLELFVESTETPEATEIPELTETPEATEAPEVTETPEITETPESTETPEVTATPEATAEPTGCNRPNHPVATRISQEFGVDYQTVIQMHCDGSGFGEITRAFLLAELSGGTAQDYLDLRKGGQGWGQIMRESGVHPSELAPGRAIGRGHRDDPESTDTPDSDESVQRGNGNGNGNANRGNGNGNGNGNGGNRNGNGNGNGNGRGNGGGNGNGNGNGNGRGNGGGGGNGNGNGNGRGGGKNG